MKFKYKKSFVLALSLITSSASALELVKLKQGTIEQIPVSQSIGDDSYNEAIMAARSTEMVNVAKAAAEASRSENQLMQDAINAIFPVATNNMKPLQNQAYHYFNSSITGMPESLAVIGNDPYSLKWLREHREAFKQNNTAIMLVEVKDDREYNKIISIANGLEVIPVPGYALVEDFGLNYYPALVTPTGFGQ